MNALKLADELEVHEFTSDFLYVREVVDMLRQQQAEIEALKTKTLTDQEILEEWDWDSGEILATDLLDFADAILRKVQGDV